jgi:hypothetical protein
MTQLILKTRGLALRDERMGGEKRRAYGTGLQRSPRYQALLLPRERRSGLGTVLETLTGPGT